MWKFLHDFNKRKFSDVFTIEFTKAVILVTLQNYRTKERQILQIIVFIQILRLSIDKNVFFFIVESCVPADSDKILVSFI